MENGLDTGDFPARHCEREPAAIFDELVAVGRRPAPGQGGEQGVVALGVEQRPDRLIGPQPAWSTSITTRAKRRPKVVLVDTGLAADLCGLGEQAFAPTADGVAAGALFDTFVTTEVLKQASWSERSVDLSYFRTRDGAEVDLFVEDRRTGELAGLEIKLTSTPTARHARHLAMLRDKLGSKFATGLVIHAGSQALPLGDRLWAVPVSAVWRSDS